MLMTIVFAAITTLSHAAEQTPTQPEAQTQPSRLTAEDLEPVAKLGIQRVLSRALEVPVTVGAVKLLPDEERMVLSDVKIANPEGYEAPNALSADKIEIAADIRSLFSPSPEIKLIQVDGAKVNAETRLPQGSNITKLLNNAKAAQKGPLQQVRAPKQWRIQKGVLQGAEVNMGTQLLTTQTTQKKIGNIEMEFLGADGRGMPAQQAMAQFLTRLVEELGILPADSAGAGILEKVAPQLMPAPAEEPAPNRPGQRLREAIKNLKN